MISKRPQVLYKNYREILQVESGTMVDFLQGNIFRLMEFGGERLKSDTPIFTPSAQRQYAWDGHNIDKLLRGLFGAFQNDVEFQQKVLNDVRTGAAIYANETEDTNAPMMGDIQVKPSSNKKPGGLALIDGQQRSFTLRAILAWMVMKSGELEGDIDPILFSMLMRPAKAFDRPRHGENTQAVPRVTFHQSTEQNHIFESRGRAYNAMDYLLAPLQAGLIRAGASIRDRENRTAALIHDMKSNLGHINNRSKDSSEAAGIAIIFKRMDTIFEDLKAGLCEEGNGSASSVDVVDALVRCLQDVHITVQLLGPSVNANRRLQNANTTNLPMSESDQVRVMLGGALGLSDDEELKETHWMADVVSAAVGHSDIAEDTKLMIYQVAAAVAVGSPGPIVGGSGSKSSKFLTANMIRELLPEHGGRGDKRTNIRRAEAILRALPAATQAVLFLVRPGQTDLDKPNGQPIIPALSDDLKEAMDQHARLGIKGFTPFAAWLALTRQQEILPILKLVNFTSAENLARAMAAKLYGGSQRNHSESLDSFVKGMATQFKKLAALENPPQDAYIQVVRAKLLSGAKAWGAVHPNDSWNLLDKLEDHNITAADNPMNTSMLDPKTGVFGVRISATIEVLLGLSRKTVAAGYRLMGADNKPLGILSGQSAESLLAGKRPGDAHAGSMEHQNDIENNRKNVWTNGGGEPTPKERVYQTSEAAEEVALKRKDIYPHLIEQRKKDLDVVYKGLARQQKERNLADATREQRESCARSLAGNIPNNEVWSTVFQAIRNNIALVERLYDNKLHQLSDRRQQREVAKLIRPGGAQPAVAAVRLEDRPKASGRLAAHAEEKTSSGVTRARR